MYDNIEYLGMPLKDWQSKVFHNTMTLGELYRMIKNGVNLATFYAN